MNCVVDKVKEEQKEDVSILTHPLWLANLPLNFIIKDYELRKLHEPLSQQITRELVNLLTRKPIKLHKPLSQQITC